MRPAITLILCWVLFSILCFVETLVNHSADPQQPEP